MRRADTSKQNEKPTFIFKSAKWQKNFAQKWMNSANSKYIGNPELGKKMWELMKSGDIPEGLIPGYEQEIVLFMNKAIGILYSKK